MASGILLGEMIATHGLCATNSLIFIHRRLSLLVYIAWYVSASNAFHNISFDIARLYRQEKFDPLLRWCSLLESRTNICGRLATII